MKRLTFKLPEKQIDFIDLLIRLKITDSRSKFVRDAIEELWEEYQSLVDIEDLNLNDDELELLSELYKNDSMFEEQTLPDVVIEFIENDLLLSDLDEESVEDEKEKIFA